jgi:hypothetical protein
MIGNNAESSLPSWFAQERAAIMSERKAFLVVLFELLNCGNISSTASVDNFVGKCAAKCRKPQKI